MRCNRAVLPDVFVNDQYHFHLGERLLGQEGQPALSMCCKFVQCMPESSSKHSTWQRGAWSQQHTVWKTVTCIFGRSCAPPFCLSWRWRDLKIDSATAKSPTLHSCISCSIMACTIIPPQCHVCVHMAIVAYIWTTNIMSPAHTAMPAYPHNFDCHTWIHLYQHSTTIHELIFIYRIASTLAEHGVHSLG